MLPTADLGTGQQSQHLMGTEVVGVGASPPAKSSRNVSLDTRQRAGSHPPLHHSVAPLGAALLAVFLFASPVASQSTREDQAFLDWASGTVHRMDGDRPDCGPVREMIGGARLVAFSEAMHLARETLAFRNRLFRYLVEELGFTAIAIESGLTGGQLLHDYVLGAPSDMATLKA